MTTISIDDASRIEAILRARKLEGKEAQEYADFLVAATTKLNLKPVVYNDGKTYFEGEDSSFDEASVRALIEEA